MSEADVQIEHACPECGGDPQITRHRINGISHRAAYIAAGFWALLLVLVMAYSLPWVQDKFGNQLAIYSSSSVGGQNEYCNPLTPALPIADLRNDTTGAQQIQDLFQPLSTEYGRWWADTKIRFIFVNIDGTRYDQRTRGLGGVWFRENATTSFTDVTHEPVGDGPWDYPLDAVDTKAFSNRSNDTSWFGLQIDQTRLNGGQSYRKSINIFQILISIISVLLIVHLVFRLLWALLMKRGRLPKRHRLIHRTAISAVFVVLLVLGYRLKSEYHHIAGVYIAGVDPTQIGDWIDSDQFEQYLLNPNQAEPLLAYLRELSADLPEDLILAYQTKRDADPSSITEYTVLNAQLRYNAELMSFSRLRFLESGPNATTTPAELPGYLEPGIVLDHAPDWGELWIGYNAGSDARHMAIYWIRLIFAGFVAWTVLRLFLWAARMFVYRAQRKRVKHDQCIFCAYPLSAESILLRHGVPNPHEVLKANGS